MSILNGPTGYSAPAAIQLNLLGSGVSSLTVQATGGATITGTFQVSNDGTNWAAITGTPLAGGSATSSIAGDGFWIFTVAGYRSFRVNITAITGTETITVVGGP